MIFVEILGFFGAVAPSEVVAQEDNPEDEDGKAVAVESRWELHHVVILNIGRLYKFKFVREAHIAEHGSTTHD